MLLLKEIATDNYVIHKMIVLYYYGIDSCHRVHDSDLATRRLVTGRSLTRESLQYSIGRYPYGHGVSRDNCGSY